MKGVGFLKARRASCRWRLDRCVSMGLFSGAERRILGWKPLIIDFALEKYHFSVSISCAD